MHFKPRCTNRDTLTGTHRCKCRHNIPQHTLAHTPGSHTSSAYKSAVESPKESTSQKTPLSTSAVHATPRGARRFHALRLAKWMLSVMRFLCKFSPKKEPNTHAYKHTHTQTQMKQTREGRDNRSAMISLPRSRPDRPNGPLRRRRAISLPHPHGINKRARRRQTSGNIPSEVGEVVRQRGTPSVHTPPIEKTKHLWVLRQSRPTTPCISPSIPIISLIISEKGLSLVQRPSVRPTILGRSNPVRIVVFNYNHKVS